MSPMSPMSEMRRRRGETEQVAATPAPVVREHNVHDNTTACISSSWSLFVFIKAHALVMLAQVVLMWYVDFASDVLTSKSHILIPFEEWPTFIQGMMVTTIRQRQVYLVIAAISCITMLCEPLRRLSALSFSFFFTALWGCDASLYNNHYYLFTLMSVYIALIPTSTPSGKMVYPKWAYTLLKGQICIVYLYAAVAKTRFLAQARPIAISALNNLVQGQWVQETNAYLFFALSGLLVDTMIPLGYILDTPWTRSLAIITSISFHIMNVCMWDIGVFPFYMMASNVLFMTAASTCTGSAQSSSTRSNTSTHHTHSSSRWRVVVSIILLLQVLVPMRGYVSTFISRDLPTPSAIYTRPHHPQLPSATQGKERWGLGTLTGTDHALSRLGLYIPPHLQELPWYKSYHRWSWRMMSFHSTPQLLLTFGDPGRNTSLPYVLARTFVQVEATIRSAVNSSRIVGREQVDLGKFLTPRQLTYICAHPASFVNVLHRVRTHVTRGWKDGQSQAKREKRVGMSANVLVSLNGRPFQRLLRPDIDLLQPSVVTEYTMPLVHEFGWWQTRLSMQRLQQRYPQHTVTFYTDFPGHFLSFGQVPAWVPRGENGADHLIVQAFVLVFQGRVTVHASPGTGDNSSSSSSREKGAHGPLTINRRIHRKAAVGLEIGLGERVDIPGGYHLRVDTREDSRGTSLFAIVYSPTIPS